MKKFKVSYPIIVYASIEVKAEDEDEAIDIAGEKFNPITCADGSIAARNPWRLSTDGETLEGKINLEVDVIEIN